MSKNIFLKENLALKLLKVKAHYGHSQKNLNMKLLPYIFGIRNNIVVLNVEKTVILLRILYCFMVEVIARRGFFLLFGGNQKIPFSLIFKALFSKYSMKNLKNFNNLGFYLTGYFSKNWIAGTFTNWKIVYNFLKINSRTRRIRRKYPHAYNEMYHIIPDIIFCFDSNKHLLKEAKFLDIPLVGIVDSNEDFNYFLYKFIGNNDSYESILFFCSFLENVIKDGEFIQNELFFYYIIKHLKLKLSY